MSVFRATIYVQPIPENAAGAVYVRPLRGKRKARAIKDYATVDNAGR